MSGSQPSNQAQHLPGVCTVCAARQRRHEARNNSIGSKASSSDSHPRIDRDVETQLVASESVYDPPPPYSKRRRHQKLDAEPPTYAKVITSPPPGVTAVTIPVTVRYIENLILEDDGYSKVICPTARKFRANIRVYDTMDWNRFWECLRQLKPSVTMKHEALGEVRGLRRKGQWERALHIRFHSQHLKRDKWGHILKEMCSGAIDKLVVTACSCRDCICA